MARKLVTLRRVTAIRPIPGADRIVAATVGGWTCVVGADEFRPGDVGVYFEIDSFLPAADARWERFAPGFSDFVGARGFRVRTLKLRGQISQGLLLPVSRFAEVEAAVAECERAAVAAGDLPPQDPARAAALDAAVMALAFEDLLGVVKYDPPSAAAADSGRLGPFPVFIARTDQERVQNLPADVFARHAQTVFQETTKMDGSSMTVYFVRRDSPLFEDLPPLPGDVGATGRFGVCSRNIELAESGDNSFWAAALANGLPGKLAALGRNLALQGELVGEGVQGNAEGFPRGFRDLFVFGAQDIDAQRPLPPREVEALARELGLRHVPVVGYAALREIAGSVEELLARAEGKGINGRKREGIVLKAGDGAFSFKAISNSYLLKRGE